MRGLLLLWLTLAACDVSELNGTALLITARADGDTPLEQLRYRAQDERGVLAFGPQTRPELAAGRLPSTTVVRVLLPDTNDGQVIEVNVEGLIRQAVVLEGRALVRIERGREAAATIDLLPPRSGCSSCPGCCSAAGTCFSPSLAACGAGGSACVACGVRGDSCGAAGNCACGSGPACSSGQACVGGSCECTVSSCVGCCSGTSCLFGTTNSTCGSGGEACSSCAGPASDGCRSDGSCGCGSAPACAAGSVCVGGACACDATTCAGCCSESGECLGGTTRSSCGAGGAACRACSRHCAGGACE